MILRPYQQAAVSALMQFWRTSPKGIPLLVCPTGSGKSLIGAEICKIIHDKKPEYKGYIVSHSKEIISQNAKTISKHMSDFPVGIYSAGLGIKQFRKITCCNIQSVYKKDLPEAQYVCIDECHKISSDSGSMYQKFLNRLTTKNPDIKIFGLTATPFRSDSGSLVGELFSEVVYDISIPELIEDGYLAPIISLPSKNGPSLKGLRVSGCDFNQHDMQEVFDIKELVEKHVAEIIDAAKDRKHWLVFSSGVKHAKDLCEEFKAKGIEAEYVTGEMLAMERDQKLRRFKNGETRALVNCDILTTGFDFPGVDVIGIVRATKSIGLYVQIVGRGMRVSPDKNSCLLLDFGTNCERFGPIDCIQVGRKKDKDGKVEITKAPVKECQKCGTIIAIRYTICPNCGDILPKFVKDITIKPSDAPVLSQPELLEVDSTEYKIHKKDGSPDMLRINYLCGIRLVMEFLCFDHRGYAAQMARKKWCQLRSDAYLIPQTTIEAFNNTSQLKIPAEIEVIKQGKYYRVLRITKEKETEAPDEFLDKYNIG